ncbi:Abi family protein [Bacteroides sp. 519]|uniref:Abi family protein n=1 Tax=Bacteroides sp. 519 TaxID=2302937 RepID=UPI0013D45AE0|nr:Abi family protein [Bacteroides sp. 519]NDV60319.1 hypothetical protein [Bacteroides sp. 519]
MSLNYLKIKKYISAPRLQVYEIVSANNTKRALKTYQANIRLAQAYYPLLTIVEVVLRNAINEELSTHFSDPHWLITQRTGFMIDPSLTHIDRRTGATRQNHYLKNSVQKSINKIGTGFTQGKIIANLDFGFWTAFFDNYHYRILAGVPIQIFSTLPTGTNRGMIFDKLTRIREFRNRLYHNEAIIFNKDTAGNPFFSLRLAKTVYKDIQDIFEWLNLDFIRWTKRINNVDFELKRMDYVYNFYPLRKYYYFRIKLAISHYKNKYLK